jgi:hypothetical protein
MSTIDADYAAKVESVICELDAAGLPVTHRAPRRPPAEINPAPGPRPPG